MKAKVKPSEQIGKPDGRIRHGLLWGLLIVVIVGIVGANLWSLLHKRVEAPKKPASPLSGLAVHNRVPDFALTDQNGHPLTLSALQGKIWVADFIFTSCVAVCPLMTNKMAGLQDEFASVDIYFVSFSVDPERDKPEVLSQYAARYGANPNRWFFLTGEKGAIYRLAQEGFNLAAGTQGTEILHSTRFVLIDRQGQIRGYYDSNENDALQQLRRDIRSLL
jgi:protein SCO1/2